MFVAMSPVFDKIVVLQHVIDICLLLTIYVYTSKFTSNLLKYFNLLLNQILIPIFNLFAFSTDSKYQPRPNFCFRKTTNIPTTRRTE